MAGLDVHSFSSIVAVQSIACDLAINTDPDVSAWGSRRSPAWCRVMPLFNCGTRLPDADLLQAKSENAGMGFEEYGATAIPSEKNDQRA